MHASQTSSQTLKPSTSWLTILQLTFSAGAAVLLLGAGLTIAMVNITHYFIQAPAGSDPTQSLMVAASLAFAGSMAIPSAWYAWKRLAQPDAELPTRPERSGFGVSLTIMVLVLVSGALFLGNQVSTNPRISWFLLPILNLIATGLPALWVVYIGTHGLIPGKLSRKWGVFASSLILSPVVILILELFILVGIGILVLLWIMLNPDLANQVNNLVFRVQNSGGNPETLLRILLPFLLNPVILLLVFAYISVLVPMLEEALKPMGVWLIARLKITPTQGFGYGVLCGAGFGLFENLGNTSGGGEAWVLLASARISTLFLHSLNTGLVGWALASAWGQKRYLRLGITFIYVVLMHGLWNGLAVLSFITSMESLTGISIPDILVQLGGFSPIVIVALGAFNLVFFIGFSTTLRRTVHAVTSQPGVGLHESGGLIEQASPDSSSPASLSGDDKPGVELKHSDTD